MNFGKSVLSLPLDAAPFGFGCSKLGSINGANRRESTNLLLAALDGGVRFFDTSNVYGQGDSERFLGSVVGGEKDCVICTKGGKFLPWKKKVIVPAKSVLRIVARRSSFAEGEIKSARSIPLPVRWDPADLARQVERSLKRLKRDRIDIYLLHGPSSSVLRQGDAISAIEDAKLQGKIGLIGVSVDSVEEATLAISDNRVDVIQVPLWPGDNRYDGILEEARKAGVVVIAREIIAGGAAALKSKDPSEYIIRRIEELKNNDKIFLPIIGTTNLKHMEELARGAKS